MLYELQQKKCGGFFTQIHPLDASDSLCLLFAELREVAEILRQRKGRIVTRGQHCAVQQVLDRNPSLCHKPSSCPHTITGILCDLNKRIQRNP